MELHPLLRNTTHIFWVNRVKRSCLLRSPSIWTEHLVSPVDDDESAGKMELPHDRRGDPTMRGKELNENSCHATCVSRNPQIPKSWKSFCACRRALLIRQPSGDRAAASNSSKTMQDSEKDDSVVESPFYSMHTSSKRPRVGGRSHG